MNKMITIFKTMVKNDINQIINRFKKNDPVVMIIGSTLFLAFGIVFLTMIYRDIFDLFQKTGLLDLLLLFHIIFPGTVILFLNLFNLINKFYDNDFSRHLISMPLKPYQIFGAHFFKEILFKYFYILIFFIPGFFLYGISAQTDMLYWLYGLVIALLLPVIPMSIAAFFATGIMRIVNLSNYKKLFQILGSILGLVLFMVWMLFYDRLFEDIITPETLEQMALYKEEIIEFTGYSFPPALWALRTLTATGISAAGWFLLFIFISVIMLFLVFLWAEKLYFGGLIGINESGQKNKFLNTSEKLKKAFKKKRSPENAILIKEWIHYVKTPPLIKESLWALIFPALIILSSLIDGDYNLLQMVSELEITTLLIYSGIWGLSAPVFSYLPVSSFSREGKKIWLSKIIPVSINKQIRGKQLFNLSQIIILTIPLFLFFYLTTSISLPVLLLCSLTAFIISVSSGNFLLLLDILYPNTSWDNHQQITGFFKTLSSWIIGLLLLGLYALLFYLLLNLFSLKLLIALIYLISFIIAFIANRLCLYYAKDLFDRINIV